MSVDYASIGRRIKQARKAKGLTQDELSESMGVSVAYLSKVETGNIHLNLNRLCQICSILEVAEGQILDGVSNSNIYLDNEFADLISLCSPHQQKIIYEIAKVVYRESDFE